MPLSIYWSKTIIMLQWYDILSFFLLLPRKYSNFKQQRKLDRTERRKKTDENLYDWNVQKQKPSVRDVCDGKQ